MRNYTIVSLLLFICLFACEQHHPTENIIKDIIQNPTIIKQTDRRYDAFRNSDQIGIDGWVAYFNNYHQEYRISKKAGLFGSQHFEEFTDGSFKYCSIWIRRIEMDYGAEFTFIWEESDWLIHNIQFFH